MPAVGGFVFDSSGAPINREIRIYRRDTGALLGKTRSSGGDGDPYFDKVTLLLHCDGADGSTTFTDNSRVVRAPTVVGAAKIGTAQSAFGGSSGNFTIAGSSIEYASSEDFDWKSASYTIELMAYITAYGGDGVGTPLMIGVADITGGILYWGFGPNKSGKLTFYYWSGTQTKFTGSSTIPLNQWVHLAMSFDGTSVRLFVNGAPDGTFAYSVAAPSSGSTPFRVGFSSGSESTPCAFFCDELRITKGVARYTASFTPPAAPFPDIPGSGRAMPLGEYYFATDYTGEVQVVCVDDASEPLENDLILRTFPV